VSVIGKDSIVTDVVLASLAGVSARRIRQLAEDGRLERVGTNKYVLGDAIRALLVDAAGSGSELQRQRTRKVAADAAMAELELAKAMGAVAPLDQIQRVWERSYAMLRQAILTVPARVSMNLVGEKSEARIKQVLKTELSDALTRFADAPLTLDEDEDEDEDEQPSEDATRKS